MIALKLTLVPAFLWLVSMSGKWWGPTIAGWLAGLPVVAGSILFLLVLEHGSTFGARAATLSLSAILASEAFNFAYASSCRAKPWPIALTAGLIAWLLTAGLLSFLPVSPLWAIGVAIVAVLFGQAFLPLSQVTAANSPLTRSDLAGRMAAGAALTILVTALSSSVGPKWSGLLAVFPLLGIVLSVSSHRAYGADFVISLLRGMVLGRFSFAAFCLCLSFALQHQSVVAAFVESAVLSMLVQWSTKRLANAQHVQSRIIVAPTETVK